MKKQSTLFVFKFRGKREKDKADSDSTVPAKSTDKTDSGASTGVAKSTRPLT